jgi:beta-glucosidase
LLAGYLAVVVYVWGMDYAETVPPVTDKIWLDTSRSLDERADALVAHMTLREKIGQMSLVEKNSLQTINDIRTYHLGGVLSGAGAKPDQNTAAGWATMIAEYQAVATTTRLQIPLLYGVDAVHGHALVPGATVFPHQIGLGATGDATLVEQIARATAADLRATGVNWNYAPNLDLPQDARWGRMYEAFSDDPLLTSRLAAAYVRGLQATSSAGNVAATLKHYIGLGGMEWQTSTNKNFLIDQGRIPPSETELRVSYLPPFAAGIDAGAQSVMVGLSGWGDSKLVNQHYLITEVLKDEFGFSGFVVSDWYGIYEGNGNRFLATVRSINAGIDMVMLPFDYKTFERHMVIANRLGLISTERIDDAVRRIVRVKLALGLFDPVATVPATLGDHRTLAQTAVAQSLVLLKNDAATLPIRSDVRHIRVAGSAAHNVGRQAGAWTVEWQGVDGNWLPGGISILDGITMRAPKNTVIEYSATGTFASTKVADLGIAVVGEAPYAEGWGDRAYPILSNEDLAVIAELKRTSQKVVVILVSGRPLLIEREIDSIDALVAAWLPGTAGDGVAAVLFGDSNFRGTLPVPWPKTAEQFPLTPAGEAADGTPLLFPRYYGLSY